MKFVVHEMALKIIRQLRPLVHVIRRHDSREYCFREQRGGTVGASGCSGVGISCRTTDGRGA